MKVTKRNPLTGKLNTKELPITQKQYDSWQDGELIQNAMPNLSATDREFLITGIPDDKTWFDIMGDELDGENDNPNEPAF